MNNYNQCSNKKTSKKNDISDNHWADDNLGENVYPESEDMKGILDSKSKGCGCDCE